MFKIKSLSTDKKNLLTLEVTLRGHYVKSIKSEKQLILTLQNSINNLKSESEKDFLQKKLNNSEILAILRYWGIVSKTKIIKIE